jgi:type IV pilus assembly protein PilX
MQPDPGLRRQDGVILIVTLICMVALAIASIALVRGVDTANIISGNMGFRQAAMQAADIGVEAAFNALPTIISTSLDADIANQYYATRQEVDSKGMPTSVTWSSVPCRDSAGAAVTCSVQPYQIKYVIDRLCDGTLPITDVAGSCYTDTSGSGIAGGSKKSGAAVFSKAGAIYYRITVQVSGPRYTQSYVQVIVARG